MQIRSTSCGSSSPRRILSTSTLMGNKFPMSIPPLGAPTALRKVINIIINLRNIILKKR